MTAVLPISLGDWLPPLFQCPGQNIMLTRRNPETVAPPRRYTHSVEAPPGTGWVHISGQVGVRPDGQIAENPMAQIDQVWANLATQLEAAELNTDQVVKLTVFLTRREDIPYYRETRDRFFGDVVPASTLLLVSGLADPAMTVEIEAVCARPG